MTISLEGHLRDRNDQYEECCIFTRNAIDWLLRRGFDVEILSSAKFRLSGFEVSADGLINAANKNRTAQGFRPLPLSVATRKGAAA